MKPPKGVGQPIILASFLRNCIKLKKKWERGVYASLALNLVPPVMFSFCSNS